MGQSGKDQRSQRQKDYRGVAREEPALPTGRAERSAIESLAFTLKEGFEFGEMVRRTHENVLAEMLEKMLVITFLNNRMHRRLASHGQARLAFGSAPELVCEYRPGAFP